VSIAKGLVKIEKKFPKEDISSYKDKLTTREQAFLQQSKVTKDVVTPINKISHIKVPSKKAVKPTTKRVDRLYQLAVVSLNNKFNDYDKLLAQKKYGLNSWFNQLASNKKIVVRAIKHIEEKWPNNSAQAFYNELKDRDEKLNKNTFNFIDKAVKLRFSKLDSLMKENKYGNKKWNEGLKAQAKNVSNAINYLAKKWPTEAKPYQKAFKKRIDVIKKHHRSLAKKAQRNKQIALRKTAPPKINIPASKTVKTNILASVKKDQENFIQNGKAKVWGNSTGWSEKSDGA